MRPHYTSSVRQVVPPNHRVFSVQGPAEVTRSRGVLVPALVVFAVAAAVAGVAGAAAVAGALVLGSGSGSSGSH